jgi:D-alanyl-D-alanine carboxypeptidase
LSGVILVARNGRTVYQKSCGYADRDRHLTNRLDTKFNLGSINKMFTGISIPW